MGCSDGIANAHTVFVRVPVVLIPGFIHGAERS